MLSLAWRVKFENRLLVVTNVTSALVFSPLLGARYKAERSDYSAMINVLVHHEVADYSSWKVAFDSAIDLQHKNGERGCRIFHGAGNVNDLTLFFEWGKFGKGASIPGFRRNKSENGSSGG